MPTLDEILGNTPKTGRGLDEILRKESLEKPKASIKTLAGQRLSRLKTEKLGEEAKAIGKEEELLKAGLTAAEMAPFALAAPLTAGASIPVAAGIMAGAGAVGGGIREYSQFGLTGKKRTASQLAGSIALDAAIGATWELGIGGIKSLAKVGGPLWEKALLKASQKTTTGRAIATDMEVNAYQPLEQSVAGRVADVRSVYERFLHKIGMIPKGRGKTGKGLAGPVGGRIGELVDWVSADMKAVQPRIAVDIGSVGSMGQAIATPASRQLPAAAATAIEPYAQELRPLSTAIGGAARVTEDITKQPLDALIRMHSTANRLAWGAEKGLDPDVAAPARKAAREFADDLNKLILSKIGPKEKELYLAAKSITKARHEYEIALEFAKKYAALKSRSFLGYAAAATGVEAVEKKYAPILLESLVKNNKAAYQKAVERLMNGETMEQVAKVSLPWMTRAVPIEVMQRFTNELQTHREERAAEKQDSVVKQGQGGSTP